MKQVRQVLRALPVRPVLRDLQVKRVLLVHRVPLVQQAQLVLRVLQGNPDLPGY